MAGPIYVFSANGRTDAWYQLSDEERESLMERVRANAEEVDEEIIIGCESRWASDEWDFFLVPDYSDIGALQRETQLNNELNWFRYLEATSILATKWEPPS